MKSAGVAIGESPPPSSHKIQYAGVAQQVERFTCNEDVAGSIPVTSSKWFRFLKECFDVPYPRLNILNFQEGVELLWQ